MKLIYNKFIPFKGFRAINLFGVCFVREAYEHQYDYDYLKSRKRFAQWR